MAELCVGYLFKKKHIFYQSKKYEIFEFLDYVAGIGFTNIINNETCNVLSGRYAGIYASLINKKANENKYAFFLDSINQAVQDNNTSVNFFEIRERRIATTAKYYLRNNKGNKLTKLTNTVLVNFLEKENAKGTPDLNEKVFEKKY